MKHLNAKRLAVGGDHAVIPPRKNAKPNSPFCACKNTLPGTPRAPEQLHVTMPVPHPAATLEWNQKPQSAPLYSIAFDPYFQPRQ